MNLNAKYRHRPATDNYQSYSITKPVFLQVKEKRHANQAFNDYQRLNWEGKLGEAGQKPDELKRLVGELNARQR